MMFIFIFKKVLTLILRMIVKEKREKCLAYFLSEVMTIEKKPAIKLDNNEEGTLLVLAT